MGLTKKTQQSRPGWPWNGLGWVK